MRTPTFFCVLLIGILCATGYMVAATDARVAEAAMKNDTDAVRSLIKQAADVNAAQGDGMTALHWAALNGNAELAQLLLVAGANVKATTRIGAYTPLFMAAKNGSSSVVAALLKAGADVQAKTRLNGITPLFMASKNGNAPIIQLLIKAGADPLVAEGLHEQAHRLCFIANSVNFPVSCESTIWVE